MTQTLVICCVVLTVLLGGAVLFSVALRIKLRKYAAIDDIEKHVAKQSAFAAQCQQGAAAAQQTAAEEKKRWKQYSSLVELGRSLKETQRNCQSKIKKWEGITTERVDRLESECVAELQEIRATHREREQTLKLQVRSRESESEKLLDQAEAEKSELEQELRELQRSRGKLQTDLAAAAVGISNPVFEYDHPDAYRAAITANVAARKRMVSEKTAYSTSITFTMDGSEAKGRKMIKDQGDLMLRGFNGECDTAITKVKHGNLSTIVDRVSREFARINKLGESKGLSIAPEYLDLRIKELHLTNQWELLKYEEKEREREIRDQIREETRAEKEYEKAKREAGAQEAAKAKALEEARSEIESQHGKRSAAMERLIEKLESELAEASQRSRAIAQASLTRSGHVYVLSNIGTMGKLIYKIGMTRRLDPQDRVKELSDASVPFDFDVHAMIRTNDAPTLEKELHKYFDQKRVNKVNLRREYFRVTLDEIQKAVVDLHDGDVVWVVEPEARQFRETLEMGGVEFNQEQYAETIAG